MPDPTNPQPGDKFVGKNSGGTITVHAADDRAVVFFYDDRHPEGPYVFSPESFAANFVPVVEPWPEPPTKWAVQWRDKNGPWFMSAPLNDEQSANAECNRIIADGYRARVVPYVPQVTE